MTIEECAKDSSMSGVTIRRWVKAGRFPSKKKGLREIYVSPEDWGKFCRDNNIQRRGE